LESSDPPGALRSIRRYAGTIVDSIFVEFAQTRLGHQRQSANSRSRVSAGCPSRLPGGRRLISPHLQWIFAVSAFLLRSAELQRASADSLDRSPRFACKPSAPRPEFATREISTIEQDSRAMRHRGRGESQGHRYRPRHPSVVRLAPAGAKRSMESHLHLLISHSTYRL
jgi:hypothetical protein